MRESQNLKDKCHSVHRFLHRLGGRIHNIISIQKSEDDKSSDFSLFYKGFPHFSGADFLFFKTLKNERKNAKNWVGTKFGIRFQRKFEKIEIDTAF